MINKTEFIKFMMRSRVLLFGDFTTKSGRKTPYFINTGNYVYGEQLKQLGAYYASAVHESFGESVTNLFGPSYKGIPIATAASISLHEQFGRNITVSFNRKEVKDHGEGGWLMGHEYAKSQHKNQVVIVEDVTTAGTSIRECLPSINNCKDTSVIGLVVSVDRMERGKSNKGALAEVADEFGIKTVSLINFNDLLDFLEKNPDQEGVPAGALDRMLDYRRQYGVN